MTLTKEQRFNLTSGAGWLPEIVKNKKDNDREDLFAATPPAEAERMALSKAATRSRGKYGRMRKRKLMFIDAKKAHLNPKCLQKVFIDLPEEAEQGEGVCGELVFWLYGCRPAAQAWENFYSEKLVRSGVFEG